MLKIEEHKAQKNTDGHLGPKCNNCGGFGFTLGIAGTDHGCKYCNQTGIASLSNAELQTIVVDLAQQITELKNIIIKELRKK